MSNSRITIEASSSPVGRPDSYAILDIRDGKLRLVNSNRGIFNLRQVNSNVDIQVNLPELPPVIVPRVTNITPYNLRYRIDGVGSPGSIITINGISTTVSLIGQFTITTTLSPGINEVVQILSNGTNVTNTIYLTNSEPDDNIPVVITMISGEDINGIGPPDINLTIGDVTTTTDSSGRFSLTTSLSPGINVITSDGDTVGSIYFEESMTVNPVTISSIDSSDDGYYITGEGIVGENITINGESVTINSDGQFSLTTTLIEGYNPITSEDNVVGSIYVRSSPGDLVSITEIREYDGHVDSPTYELYGVGPPGLTVTIADVTSTIDSEGQLSTMPVLKLEPGINPITSDGEVIGSLYLQPQSYARVLSMVKNSDDSYAIEGIATPNIPVAIEEETVQSSDDGVFTMTVQLNDGLNEITYGESNSIIGSIFINSGDVELLDEVNITGYSIIEPEVTILGSGPPGGSVVVNTQPYPTSANINDDGTFSISYDNTSIDGMNILTFTDNNRTSQPIAIVPYNTDSSLLPSITGNYTMSDEGDIYLEVVEELELDHQAQYSLNGGTTWLELDQSIKLRTGTYVDGAVQLRQINVLTNQVSEPYPMEGVTTPFGVLLYTVNSNNGTTNITVLAGINCVVSYSNTIEIGITDDIGLQYVSFNSIDDESISVNVGHRSYELSRNINIPLP